MPPLDGGAHHWSLRYAGLQLPLGRQVDDDGQVDEGHRAQHAQGLEAKSFNELTLYDKQL